MALVPAICTQCGAQIEVDDTHEAGICKFCGTAFITEKAINTDIGGILVPKEIGNRIKNLVEQGEVIKAIKELREATGLGLKEAKDAIDAYQGMTTNNVKTTTNNTTSSGETRCFKSFWKECLDKIVSKLNNSGIEN